MASSSRLDQIFWIRHNNKGTSANLSFEAKGFYGDIRELMIENRGPVPEAIVRRISRGLQRRTYERLIEELESSNWIYRIDGYIRDDEVEYEIARSIYLRENPRSALDVFEKQYRNLPDRVRFFAEKARLFSENSRKVSENQARKANDFSGGGSQEVESEVESEEITLQDSKESFGPERGDLGSKMASPKAQFEGASVPPAASRGEGPPPKPRSPRRIPIPSSTCNQTSSTGKPEPTDTAPTPSNPNPPDPNKPAWDLARQVFEGFDRPRWGSLVGKALREHGIERTLNALEACERATTEDPIPYFQACLFPRRNGKRADPKEEEQSGLTPEEVAETEYVSRFEAEYASWLERTGGTGVGSEGKVTTSVDFARKRINVLFDRFSRVEIRADSKVELMRALIRLLIFVEDSQRESQPKYNRAPRAFLSDYAEFLENEGYRGMTVRVLDPQSDAFAKYCHEEADRTLYGEHPLTARHVGIGG